MSDLGSNIGRYQILNRISVGGMAEVFRAKAVGESGFEKTVALKRILPHMSSDQEFVNMFIDEARTVAQLSHTNICQIFEFGQEEGTYFIALELVEGKDLKRIMEFHRKSDNLIPLAKALFISWRTCEALDYAHNCCNAQGEPMNIVHRDVSPQNVLISYNGDVKLIDFGIAKAMGRLTSTVAGSIKGKFGYMSPEQVSGKPIDLRSDIFACGTVLYEMVTNTRLFKGESDIATMQMVRKADIPAPSTLNPLLPPELDPILMRSLTRDRDERYSNAGEFLDALEELAISTGNTCSTKQLSRWMNDLFEEDRKRAEEKVRTAEKQAAQVRAGNSIDTNTDAAALQEHSEPSAPVLPVFQATEPSFTGVLGQVTGRAEITGTHTGTEFVTQKSSKAWILVAILAVVLITGAAGVILMWPESETRIISKTRVIKVPQEKPAAVAKNAPKDASSPAAPDSGAAATKQADGAVAKSGGSKIKPDRPPSTSSKSRAPDRKTGPGPKKVDTSPKPAPKAAVTPEQPRPVEPPTKPTPAAEPGRLIIASKPWARVWIDGKDTGRNTPIAASSPIKLKPGRHLVSLYVNDRRFDFYVSVKSGELSKLVKKLPASR